MLPHAQVSDLLLETKGRFILAHISIPSSRKPYIQHIASDVNRYSKHGFPQNQSKTETCSYFPKCSEIFHGCCLLRSDVQTLESYYGGLNLWTQLQVEGEYES